MNDRGGEAGTDRPRFVLASANPKKVAEMRWVLGDAVELLPRPPQVPDVVEDADTFEGNARLKALALSAATGEAALADDSGLEVDALDGAPGVRSARYAGEQHRDEDNVAKLLDALGAVPADRRTARFRSVVVAHWPDGTEIVADGTVEGTIADRPRGTEGFGYDPVFLPAERTDGLTFAELSRPDKHAISHRGRSLRAFLQALDQLPT